MFTDSFRIERVDHSENNPVEDRIQTIGLVGKVLFVVYTERKEACRLISVRIANKKEKRLYYGNCKENSSDWGSTYQISFKRGRRNCKKKGSIIKFVGFRVSDILPSAFIHYL